MYEFHYKDIKSIFDAKLLFTDTDSLIYKIKTEDFYQDKNVFGFSDWIDFIHWIQSSLILLIRKLLAKWKMISKKKKISLLG